MSRDYYIVLGIGEGASEAEIRDAYHHLARKLHPDTSGADTARQFLEVQEAWQTLGDAERRRVYDARNRAARDRRERRNMPATHRPNAPPVRPNLPEWGGPLRLTVRISQDEAIRGVAVPLDLPAVAACPACGGKAGGLARGCRVCRGRGLSVEPRSFVIRIPPGVASGHIMEASLAGLDLVHDRLVIQILVLDTVWHI